MFSSLKRSQERRNRETKNRWIKYKINIKTGLKYKLINNDIKYKWITYN